MGAELVSSVQACAADMPKLLKEECKIMRLDDDKITDVTVRSGDRSWVWVQILEEKCQGEDEAKDSWTVREKEEHWYAGARTINESPTTATDANTQSKVHEVHKGRLQRLLPLEDVCIKKMKIAKRS